MDQREQQLIDGLFEKVRDAEETSGPRDREAENVINRHLVRQPSAPYYLAQMVIVQEHALRGAQERIEELEQQLSERQSSGSGGFLGGLFGGGPSGGNRQQYTGSVPSAGMRYPAQQSSMPSADYHPAQPQPQYQQSGGPSFLAGAAQTAAGVAGGLLLGNALTSMFGGHSTAHASTPASGASKDAAGTSQAAAEGSQAGGGAGENVQYADYDGGDAGGDFGGDFDFDV